MKIGYARVSTKDQELENQKARLKATGCETLFEEKISGVAKKRPQLEKLLSQLLKDDVLVVTSSIAWRGPRLIFCAFLKF